MLVRTVPCVGGCSNRAVIMGCNKGTVVGRRLGTTIVDSLILVRLIKIGIILIRNNKPRVGTVLGTINGRDGFVGNVEIASGRAVSVIRVILTNGIGGDLIRLLNDRNNGTVKLYNLSNEVLVTRGLIANTSLNCINRVGRIGPRPLGGTLTDNCVPVISAITNNCSNGMCGVGTSVTTSRVTTGVNTGGLVLVASVEKLLHSIRSRSSLVPIIGIDRIPVLGHSNVVDNNVVPGVSYYIRTIHDNMGHTRVVSNEVRRSVLLRLFDSRNVNAVFC